MLILCLLICHTIFKRECMCETMNPGPFLIIRNNFPTSFKHFLHTAIFQSENTKTRLFIAFTYKNPKNTIHHNYYHPCIIVYHHCIFIYCFCIIYYLNIILTPYAWQPLGEVEGTKQSTLFAGNLEKDKEIKSPLLIPREFDIKPSSHLLGK